MADMKTGRDARITHGVHRNQNVVFIELTQGRRAIVDADVWPRIVRDYGQRWVYLSSGNGYGYARKGITDEHGVPSYITLARAVMEAEPGERVEVLNRDALDCRRSNLHKLTIETAAKRRKQYAEKKAAREIVRYDAARERHDRKNGQAKRRRQRQQSRRDWHLPADRLAKRFKASSDDRNGGV